MAKAINLTYYVIADTEDYGKNAPAVTIEKHTFNSKKDYDTVIDYLEDDDTMNDIDEITPNNITKADFDAACRKYLIAEVCAEWEQDLLACVLLTEEQFKLIQSFKV